MPYILGLILILGIIFSVTTGINPVGDIWHRTTGSIKEFAFPRSQKEIAIDNLGSQYSELEKFFSSVAPSLISSDVISSQDKEVLKRATQVFGESQNTIEQIKKLEQAGKSVTKALIKKVLNLDDDSAPSPDPTHIPPNCNLVCSD